MEHGPEGGTHPHVTPFKGGTPEDEAGQRALVDARRAGQTEGQTEDGRQWKLSPPFLPDAPRYPRVDTHLWGAWPILAIETGGYNDYEVTDPYTGRVLWVSLGERGSNATVYDQLRKMIDSMEAAGFLAAASRGGEDTQSVY